MYGETEIPKDAPDVPDAQYELSFELTKKQAETAGKIMDCTKSGKSVLVNAVCGAGKTELVYPVIKYQLESGKKVGFAISRRQVVLQIAKRLSKDFPALKVIPVCEGFTDETEGDLIICTTHQLYRYTGRFDTLILDEPDAFPFKGNEVLQGIAERACRGNIIYLTATPDAWLRKKGSEKNAETVYLNERPGRNPLAVPKVYYLPGMLMPAAVYLYLRKSLRNRRRAILFFPTVKETERCAKVFGKLYRMDSITSHTKDKDRVIKDFAEGRILYLCASSILERGVTFSAIDVAVFRSDHPVFDYASLVQMTGRVGRDPAHPEGTGRFFCAKRSEEVDKCISVIRKANEDAYGAGNN